MKIKSRYADDLRLVIDPLRMPEQFRHLISLAKVWSIGDDLELESFFRSRSEQECREFVEAFSPHYDGLWQWHVACEGMIPQPDELVLFDIASNAASSVQAMLKFEG